MLDRSPMQHNVHSRSMVAFLIAYPIFLFVSGVAIVAVATFCLLP